MGRTDRVRGRKIAKKAVRSRMKLKPVRTVIIPSEDIKKGLPHIYDTPTLGEEYTRTFLIKHPWRIDEWLKPENLAGTEVYLETMEHPNYSARRADLLYIKEDARGQKEYFIIETKDALSKKGVEKEVNYFKEAKKQLRQNAKLLKAFLDDKKHEHQYRSITPILVGIEYPKGSKRGFSVGYHFTGEF